MTARAPSLVYRLVAWLVVLAVVLSAVAAVALDALFRDRALEARYAVLDAQIIALVGTAELEDGNGLVPATVAEARLTTPGSGLYAEIRDVRGAVTWRSPSALGSDFGLRATPAPGERAREQARLGDGTRLLGLSLGVRWDTGAGNAQNFYLSAAESLEPYYAEVRRLRWWLAVGSVLLMLALAGGLTAGLRIGLRPLTRLEREIAEVEAGRRETLGERWPRELAGVTGNLNALLRGERSRLERYRATLGNLAHSLKTPLAAIQSVLATGNPDAPAVIARQTGRMQDIVEHQLRRAVLAGAGATLASAAVAPPLRDLVAALGKVYADKRVACELELDDAVVYPIETGDLMEIAGNLLDNAFKYGRSRVTVRARADGRPEWRRPGLVIEIEDDGSGIAPADRARVLERGVRADESVPGQGIGLAAAQEVTRAYGGSLEIGSTPAGGALLRVRLPGR